MTNTEALRSYINGTGMTIKAVANKSGMTRETFYNRLATGDFKLSEICSLVAVLRMSNDDRERIFFAQDSE